jgi:hypothetical protein
LDAAINPFKSVSGSARYCDGETTYTLAVTDNADLTFNPATAFDLVPGSTTDDEVIHIIGVGIILTPPWQGDGYPVTNDRGLMMCIRLAFVECYHTSGNYYRFMTTTYSAAGDWIDNLLAKTYGIQSCCEDVRIVGAGVKINTVESPLQTSGIVFAGGRTYEEIQTAFDYAILGTQVSGDAGPDFINKMKYKGQHSLLEGASCRLDPSQSNLIERFFATGTSKWDTPNGLPQLFAPGNLCPVVWYQPEDSAAPLSFQLSIRIHYEGHPKDSCPFEGSQVPYDFYFDQWKRASSSYATNPMQTKGHSFLSVFKRIGEIAKSALQSGSSIARNVSKFADKTADVFDYVTGIL